MIWFKYVIDGGALLHKISWGKNEPYSTILLRYFTYVDTRYPKATIVFDGYESPLSTKDTQSRLNTKTSIPYYKGEQLLRENTTDQDPDVMGNNLFLLTKNNFKL